MPEFLHQPDLQGLPPGTVYREYATKGGVPPGSIVLDDDGRHSLLGGIASNWMTYLHKFQDLLSGGSITCEQEIRIEDPRWALADYYAFDGVDRLRGYARLFVWNGRLMLGAWNNDQEYTYGHPALALIDGGPVTTAAHRIRVEITGREIMISLDGAGQIGALGPVKAPVSIDSFRTRSVGLITSMDPAVAAGHRVRGTYQARTWSGWRIKTVTVYQFWSALIRSHKVSGLGK